MDKYENISPDVEECANLTLESMFETGEVGQLIDSGMTQEEIVDSVIDQCERQINNKEMVIGTDNKITYNGDVYVKRSSALIGTFVGFFIGLTVGGTAFYIVNYFGERK